MSVESKFKEHGCVPDVVEAAPTELAQVVYSSSGSKAECGNTLTPTAVQDEPTVSWPAGEGALYTLILTDPDAPSRQDPKWGEWRHWLVVNIPGNDVAQGQVLSQYVGAGPPQDTGLHRYILLIYKQPGLLTCDEPVQGMSGEGRNNTSAAAFAAKYKLDLVAGNFFQAEWDDYVTTLNKKLGF